MRYLAVLALLLGVAGIGSPVFAEQRAIAQVTAPGQQLSSVAGVWLDASMLRRAGVEKPDQVAVRTGEKGEGAAVAARIDGENGGYRVLWQAPGADKAQDVGAIQHFTIELGKGVTPSPALEATQANLIHNGGFEQLDAGGQPQGIWDPQYSKAFYRIGQEKGNHFIAFNVDPRVLGPAYFSQPLAIEPGQSYVVSYRYRISGAQVNPKSHLDLYAYVHFLDADRKPLDPPRGSTGTFNQDTQGWQQFETTVLMPKEAHFTRMEIRNGNTVAYATAIDDVRIAPAKLKEVTSLQIGGKMKVELTAQSPDIRRFDLGPAGSPLWPGFTALTPADQYAAGKTFGFTQLTKPTALDTIRPEALTRDFICAADARLRVDLPKGAYQVWLISGDAQVGNFEQRFYFDSSVSLNGQEVLKLDESPAHYYGKEGGYWRFYHAFWAPGMDYYDTFVAAHFKTHTFKTQVDGDHLEIAWRNLPVNAIVIAPADQAEQVQGEMDELAGRRRRATQINEKPGPVEPMPKVNDAERARGFVLFRRPSNEIIYPSSRPGDGERIAELKTFAAPGQGQTVHFSLLPLKDLGAVTVTAGELRSGSNAIAASALDVRVARYIFKSTGPQRHIAADYKYEIAPFPLDHHDGVAAKEGITWSWWTTIRIPPDTPAGVYDGALAIHCGNGPAVDLPLHVRVLPYQLDALPIVQGYYYLPGEPWYSAFWYKFVYGPSYRDDPAIRKLIVDNETRQFAFMKDLGLNSAAFGDTVRGDWEYVDGGLRLKKDDRFTLWMDLYAKAGMGPMPFYGFQAIGMFNASTMGAWFPQDLQQEFSDKWDKAYRSIVTHLQERGKERGWPEILWYVSDEASNKEKPGAEKALKLAKLLEGMKGVRTISSMNGPFEHILPPHVSISMPNIAFPITDETIKMILDAGSKLWIYNCGDSRLMLGLYPWRLGAGGRFQWHYSYAPADPWDDLDGIVGDSVYSIALPSPDGVIPCLTAQAAREAISDERYMATLQNAIAATADRPDKKEIVRQARAFLADLRQRIPVDARVLIGYEIDPLATGEPVGGEFKNTDALDRIRWAAAEYILQLKR